MQAKRSWVLVTGAPKNLGRSIATSLARLGYPVVIHYNTSKSQAEEVYSECKALCDDVAIIQGDFSSHDATKRFIDEYLNRFSETLCIVNNVGNYEMQTIQNTKMDVEYSLFQTNVHAPMQISRALLSQLKSSHGCIINIGTAGLYTYRPDSKAPLYYATKAALFALTKSFAKEIAPDGIRVNMVSPGHLEHSVSRPENWDSLPMKRPALLDEVSKAIIFLIENNYITGQNIEIAGGYAL